MNNIVPLNMPVLQPSLLSGDLEALPISYDVSYTEKFPFVNTERHCSVSVSIWRENITKYSAEYLNAYLLV